MNQRRIIFTLLSIILLSGVLISTDQAFAQVGPGAPLTIVSANTITTTSVVVTFSEPVYNQGTSNGIDYGDCFTIDGNGVNAFTILPTTATGTTDSVFLITSVSFGVNDTPVIVYDSDRCEDAEIAQVNGQGPPLLDATITADDGIAPTATNAPITTDANISASEELSGFNVAVPFGSSGAAEGDELELLLGGSSFGSILTAILSSGDITNTAYEFTIVSGQLAVGPNTITAVLTDAAGNLGAESGALTLTFDDLAPTPVITLDGITSPTNVDPVTFTVNFGEPIPASFRFSLDVTASSGTVQPIVYVNAANYSFEVLNPNDNETLTVYIAAGQVTDLAGNPSFKSNTVSIDIDRTAPSAPTVLGVISFDDSGSSHTDNITNVNTPRINGISDTNVIIEIFIDGVSDGTFKDGGTGFWQKTLSSLSDSDYDITATQTDAAGNISIPSAAVSITIDTVSPTITSVTPATNTSIPLGFSVGFTNSEGISSGSITFTQTGGIIDPGTHVYPLNDGDLIIGPQSIAQSTLEVNPTFDVLVDGAVYTMTINTTDLAGNDASPVTNTGITYDTTPPPAPGTPDLATVSDTGYLSNDNITNDTTPTITGTGAEPNASIELFEEGDSLGTGTSDSFGDWSVTLNLPPSGGVSIAAIQTDAAGNTSDRSPELQILIDTTSPTPVISSTSGISGTSTNDDPIRYSVSFDESVVGFSPPGVVLSGTASPGSITNFDGHGAGSGFGNYFTFDVSPTTDGAVIVDIAAGAAIDSAGNLSSAAETFTLTFTAPAVNDPPTASNIILTTNEDTPLTITTANFGFSDVDGDTLDHVTITSLELDGGSLILAGEGAVTTGEDISKGFLDANALFFTPAPGTHSPPSVTIGFTVNDGDLDSETPNTITITVTPVNHPPTSSGASLHTNEDTPLVILTANLGFSDVDDGPADDSLHHITITTLMNTGDLKLDGVDVILNQEILKADLNANKLVFTPTANASSPPHATFGFTVSDGELDSVPDTITIAVTAQNDAPTAVDDNTTTVSSPSVLTTDENTLLTIQLSELLSNDSDVDGDTIYINEVSAISGGTVRLVGFEFPSAVAFTPNTDFNGNAQFSYTLFDTSEFATTDIATVTVVVTPLDNDPPTSLDRTVTTNEDDAYRFSLADFAFIDDDVDDILHHITITTIPSPGSLQLDGFDVDVDDQILERYLDAGKLRYVPLPDDNGFPADGFTFTVHDATTDSITPNTILIDITPVNDAPVFNPYIRPSATENELLTFTIDATDPEDDPITYSLTLFPPGAIIDSGSGEITWTPSEEDGGNTFDFTVQAYDGTDTSTATAQVTVGDVPVIDTNEDPVLDFIGDQTVRETSLLTFTASATDSDRPEQELQFVAGSGSFDEPSRLPSGAEITTDGVFTWTPDRTQSGTYDIVVVVFDEIGGYDYKEFTITVTNKSSGGGSDDNAHKTRPTFGLDHNTFKQIVDDGFTFNAKSFQIIDNFHTPFEAQTVKIGTTNTFSAKVYADKGLQVQEFLFGIPQVGAADKAELGIEVFYNYTGGVEEIKVIQDTPIVDVDSLIVTHQKSKCQSSDTEEKCDTTYLSMRFLEPLQDDVMAIKAIDYQNRYQITYLNDGFDISGDSLNPMNTKYIASPERYEGLVEITQTAKYSNLWESEDGKLFESNDHESFKWINQSFERHADSGVMKNRSHSEFSAYKQAQIDSAIQELLSICPDCLDSFADFEDSFAYELPETYASKYNDPKVIDALHTEEARAQELMEQLFKTLYPAKVFN